MLATNILTKEHKEALDMLGQLEGVDAGSSTAAATWNKVRDAIELHMREEEEIFYPALAGHEEFSDLLEENIPEHEAVIENLAQMNELEPDSDEFQELLTETKTAIEEHAAHEEENIFPESIEVLGRDEIEALGEEMEQMKGDAGMSHSASM